jgi:hypothetical protein
MRGYIGSLDGPLYFVNHNCKANAAMNIRKIKGSHSIEVHTRIAVKTGEQITFLYGRQYFTQQNPIMKCHCGNCNGTPKAKSIMPRSQETPYQESDAKLNLFKPGWSSHCVSSIRLKEGNLRLSYHLDYHFWLSLNR